STRGPARMSEPSSRMSSGQFRGLDEVNRDLLNEDDLLSSNVFLLQHPFQVPEEDRRFRILQCVDDELDVMVNDRILGPLWEPGAGPGWKSLHAGLGETTEAVVKQFDEKQSLFFREHRPASSQNRQPDSESVRKPLQWWNEPASIAVPERG